MKSPAKLAGSFEPKSVRRGRERWGRICEWIASALLVAKGYRLLDHRAKSRCGEIDIVAARGGRLIFVEVKGRRTLCEAQAALTSRQLLRIGRAAEAWRARHPRYRDHEVRLDAILVLPWRLPCHLADVA